MQDMGYDENDKDADDKLDDYQKRARQLLIDATRKNVEDNLKEAELNKHDIFIVSGSVIFSLVTAKGLKKTLAIDEARLMESILKMAHTRQYGTQASFKKHLTLVTNDIHNWCSQRSPLALTWDVDRPLAVTCDIDHTLVLTCGVDQPWDVDWDVNQPLALTWDVDRV